MDLLEVEVMDMVEETTESEGKSKLCSQLNIAKELSNTNTPSHYYNSTSHRIHFMLRVAIVYF